jgi:hypothetical protein
MKWNFKNVFIRFVGIDRQETICDEVPTTFCDLIAYPDCQLETFNFDFNETEIITDQPYVPYECSNITK